MIIDLDSHLREGYFMDEVYKLEPPFEEYTPVCSTQSIGGWSRARAGAGRADTSR
jgi:hypothetical protein